MHVETTHDRVQPVAFAALVVVSALTTAHATMRWGVTGALIATSVLLAACAAVVDAHSGRIPDVGVALTAAPPLLVMGVATATGHLGPALSGVGLGVVSFAGPMFVVHVVSPDSLGFGDVKLGAALGAALGLVEPGLGLVALCVASALTAAVGLATRRRSVPLGPGLVIGAGSALVVAARLGEGPLTWR